MILRVQAIISGAGIASRRKAEELILAGKVRVNGKIAKLGEKADSASDEVTVDGRPIRQQGKIYLMLNKPAGYACTKRGEFGLQSVYSLLGKPSADGRALTEQQKNSLFTVGRLDADAEGLLLLTNDGAWANQLAHPSAEVSRTYEVTVHGEVSAAAIQKLLSGVHLPDYFAKADSAEALSSGKKSILRLTLHSGRKHEVKELVRSIGCQVLALKRVQFGKYKLGSLQLARWIFIPP